MNDTNDSEETLGHVAERIRIAVPIAGATATDDECAKRRDLLRAALRSRGIEAGQNLWRTAQLVDGRIVGVFANSKEEAELQLGIWWASSCHWVVDDPECRVLDEYRLVGRSKGAEQVFPLGPPRTPRNRFAPAASLLDDLFLPGREPGLGWGS